MPDIVQWIKFGAVFAAALILGKWFDKERKKSMAQGRPWWAPWRTAPGIIILLIIGLLLFMRFFYIDAL